MVDKVKKEYVLAFYAVLMVVLAVVGLYFGEKSIGGKMEAAGLGALLGWFISVVLWYTWGKNNTY